VACLELVLGQLPAADLGQAVAQPGGRLAPAAVRPDIYPPGVDAPLWLTVLLTVLGFGGGYASAFVAHRSSQVDQETARRAETRERVFEAVKMLLPGKSYEEQQSGLAILRATYESRKLDPDDLDFVRSQLELVATRPPHEVDSGPSGGHTEVLEVDAPEEDE